MCAQANLFLCSLQADSVVSEVALNVGQNATAAVVNAEELVAVAQDQAPAEAVIAAEGTEAEPAKTSEDSTA